jgi:hypothetical protein
LGYPVRLRGAIRLGLSYHYTLYEAACLANYNLEAQGDILSDYYALKYAAQGAEQLIQPCQVSTMSGYTVDDVWLYEKVLTLFIYNAADTRNLPCRFFQFKFKPKL